MSGADGGDGSSSALVTAPPPQQQQQQLARDDPGGDGGVGSSSALVTAPQQQLARVLRPTRVELLSRLRGETLPTCEHCGATFPEQKMKALHMSGINGYFCEILHGPDGEFARQRSREKGQRPKNSGMPPAICPECDMQFATISVLLKHFSRKHSDERPFACVHCAYAFKTLADRNEHQELCLAGENAGKVIRCVACAFELTSREKWKEHKRYTKHKKFVTAWPASARAPTRSVPWGEIIDESHPDYVDPMTVPEAVIISIEAGGEEGEEGDEGAAEAAPDHDGSRCMRQRLVETLARRPGVDAEQQEGGAAHSAGEDHARGPSVVHSV